MASWGTGGYGTGPWGGGAIDLDLIRDFVARNSNPNEISLNWNRPDNLDTSQEIVIIRRKDQFPMELSNTDPIFASKFNVSGFTDPVQVEIFRGTLIRGSDGVGEPGKLTSALSALNSLNPLPILQKIVNPK